MKIRRVAWLAFQVPLVRPISTAHGRMDARQGVIVRLISDEALVGLGEGSPVPAFGQGTIADTLRALEQLGPTLVGRTIPEADRLLARLDPAHPGSAALAMALDSALCDLQARREGITIGRLLGGEAPRPVLVNALVGAADPGEAGIMARQAVADGFRCVKLKVGLAGSLEAELGRIGLVRSALGPNVTLRLDANGSWDVATAVALIRAAERFDLELVEQPVAAPDLAGLARVRAAVDTPIAADESIGGLEQARQVIDAEAADVLVVKPMCLGGLRPSREVIERANEAGLRVVVTTTIDTGIGVTAAVHLATTLRPAPLACGLATGGLLVTDLITEGRPVQDGWIEPPAIPGLGVVLDDADLARYGSGWREVGAE